MILMEKLQQISCYTSAGKSKPLYKTLPGWKSDIRGIKNTRISTGNCRKYIEFVEKEIGFPITMISNGPGRDDIIYHEAK